MVPSTCGFVQMRLGDCRISIVLNLLLALLPTRRCTSDVFAIDISVYEALRPERKYTPWDFSPPFTKPSRASFRISIA